ncbi:hypothetical protein [Yinghuangia seranimata]|uniref:hypothetical protein n=1 Tax=Yinghuangia seranimata TaxID=408067 RepID=UPI00248C246E|nr:hypothetical protein [Yinghuangia seranimata]MDI2128747.1 hypothetical protein [Yinghuangia seranimata]
MAGPVLDWHSPEHWNHGTTEPCVVCGEPTFLLSDRGIPCHKVCAEAWFADHPAAVPEPSSHGRWR